MDRENGLPRRVFAVVFFLLGVFICPYLLGHFTSDKAQEYEIYRSYLLITSLAFMANGVYLFFLHKLPKRQLNTSLAVIFSTIILSELVLAHGISKITGVSHMGFFGNRTSGAFVFHPSLGAVPKPGFRRIDGPGLITSHNSWGSRGAEPGERWKKAAKRIIVVGGSTTYDLTVSDKDTWVLRLDEHLGDGVVVVNFGVPGHSTAEHVVLTSLVLSQYQPDVVLFYVGANDVRNSHLANLRTDYSGYHLLNQYANLSLDVPYSFFAFTYLFKQFKGFLPSTLYFISRTADTSGKASGELDTRLAKIYRRNIRLLATITRTIGAVPVFIPQVLNKAAWTSDETGGWNVNVPKNAVPALNEAFNAIMMEAARDVGAPVVAAPAAHAWKKTDFADEYHFSPAGARTFARLVTKGLKDLDLDSLRGAATQPMARRAAP